MDPAVVPLAILVAFSIGLATWAVVSINAEAVAGATRPDEFFTENALFKTLLPYIQMIGRRIEGMQALDGFRAKIEKVLLAAGKRDTITPDEFIGTQVLFAIVGAVTGGWLAWGLDFAIEYTFPPGLLLGFALPAMLLDDMVKARHSKIRRQLPYALDLLTLAIEAGLDFTAALQRIADKLKGTPLQTEIRRLSRDIAMGKTRTEALKDMSTRVQLEELRSVVSALVQAEELGSSLGPVLRIQSEELRRKRFQLAEKKALEAPVKLLFPLVVFIFPLVFIVVFGPIIIRFMMERPL